MSHGHNSLHSQVAGNNRPVYPKVDHYWFKVAQNYEPLALQVLTRVDYTGFMKDPCEKATRLYIRSVDVSSSMVILFYGHTPKELLIILYSLDPSM